MTTVVLPTLSALLRMAQSYSGHDTWFTGHVLLLKPPSPSPINIRVSLARLQRAEINSQRGLLVPKTVTNISMRRLAEPRTIFIRNTGSSFICYPSLSLHRFHQCLNLLLELTLRTKHVHIQNQG